jgi:anti-sigma regulatory factor (Ser/Thr protein kinase)
VTTSVRVAGGPSAPHTARDTIRTLLAGRLAADDVADASIVVTELVANSVRHAHMGPEADIGVEVLVSADRLRLSVVDAGAPEAPHLAPRVTDEPCGLGLAVVDRLAAGWGVARAGRGMTRTWCELML